MDATYGSYWVWDNLRDEYPVDQQLAWEVDTWLGVGYHSYLLGTTDDLLADRPDLVSRFAAVTARGFEAATAEPELIPGLYESVAPYFPTRLLAESGRLVSGTWLHEGTWGTLRTELIEPYAAWLARNGVIGDAGVWRDAIRPALSLA